MKTILVVALSLFAVTASARMGTQFFTHSVSAPTEALVLEKVEAAIPLIQSGKIRDVFQNDCWPNNSRTIKVKSVSVKKYYKVDSYGNLNPYFTGSISYLHNRCREDR